MSKCAIELPIISYGLGWYMSSPSYCSPWVLCQEGPFGLFKQNRWIEVSNPKRRIFIDVLLSLSLRTNYLMIFMEKRRYYLLSIPYKLRSKIKMANLSFVVSDLWLHNHRRYILGAFKR